VAAEQAKERKPVRKTFFETKERKQKLIIKKCELNFKASLKFLKVKKKIRPKTFFKNFLKNNSGRRLQTGTFRPGDQGFTTSTEDIIKDLEDV
jgi:hypothetical protein